MRAIPNLLAFAALAVCICNPIAAQSQNGRAVLITFDRSHPLLDSEDDQPLVQVFYSGEVVVNRPLAYTNPGQFRLQLSADQLNELAALVNAVNDVNLTSEGMEAVANSATVFRVADPTTSRFVLNPFTANGADGAVGSPSIEVAASNEIVVEELNALSSSLPNASGISALSQLERKLIELSREVVR